MTNPDTSATGVLQQWASTVINFSSQYDSNGWPASAAVGPPRVYPRYGDIEGAWAQRTRDNKQFIELGYDTAVHVSGINIYETLHSGGVKRVSVRSPGGTWETLWETGKVKVFQESRIFSPDIKTPNFRTKEVRLDVDCSVAQSWVEIDAVELVGRKLKSEPPPSLSALADDFAKLVNDKDTSDVVFCVQGTEVYGHRAILSVRSPKLKVIMSAASEKGAIPIERMSAYAFIGVLHYVYSGRIPGDQTAYVLVDVWRAAAILQMDGLRALAVTMIDAKLDTDNVVDVYANAIAKEPISDDIREVCLEFLASNLASVSLTPQFKQLPQDLMLEIVQLSTARLSLR
ncbi:speckle-type POZ protein-like [Haliotis rufescens]|uniref:speckle-type POZ protein-like n=1 Tax=Haliotis rufescens TaxID=6454 RepID=UPI00201F94B9|nr:speckle-type POZ protein-like [Haliotis rufescens]